LIAAHADNNGILPLTRGAAIKNFDIYRQRIEQSFNKPNVANRQTGNIVCLVLFRLIAQKLNPKKLKERAVLEETHIEFSSFFVEKLKSVRPIRNA
jgi:hypothetical protein